MKCHSCKGRGRWQEVIESVPNKDGDRIAEIFYRWCNDCLGTGIEQDPEAGDDYDIGGDSYADDD